VENGVFSTALAERAPGWVRWVSPIAAEDGGQQGQSRISGDCL